MSGCENCTGGDAAAAWEAFRARPLQELIRESHFGVVVVACACGQHAVQVFAERIDWSGGEDDQTWFVIPISADELASLTRTPVEAVTAAVVAIGATRRSILRTWDEDGRLIARWRTGPMSVPLHD